ncbi:MAG TPA: hypothetical protein VEZ90_10530, partial [Blastocatellia bacterium]|nr:hypothetical protein [Blastocatellia bacterium]
MIVGIFSHVALAILTFSGSVVVPFGAHRLRAAQMAAPTKTPELPAVDTVLEKYVAATGGKEAIEKIKTITARGSISLPAIQREGSIEFYRAAPNKYLFLASITGFGLMEQCFDGKTGWSKSPKMGIRNVAAAELGQAKREADMYAPLHLKQMYSSMVVKGI